MTTKNSHGAFCGALVMCVHLQRCLPASRNDRLTRSIDWKHHFSQTTAISEVNHCLMSILSQSLTYHKHRPNHFMSDKAIFLFTSGKPKTLPHFVVVEFQLESRVWKLQLKPRKRLHIKGSKKAPSLTQHHSFQTLRIAYLKNRERPTLSTRIHVQTTYLVNHMC